jgi:1-phosphatidylinositol-4-phosphate 5-kinase
MNDNEMSVFKRALPEYFHHCRNNKNSLLARIYGLYTVQLEELAPVHILLMSNSAQIQSERPEYCFDLKGSMINREVKVKTKGTKPKGTLKDVNLLNICKDEELLFFRRSDTLKLLLRIQQDIEFLCKYALMDYSLLLIVEKNPQWEEQKLRKKTRKGKAD